jgi:hypothetical protein
VIRHNHKTGEVSLDPLRLGLGLVLVNLGRRRLEDSDSAKVAAIGRALAATQSVRRFARDLKIGAGTVLRIKSELAA